MSRTTREQFQQLPHYMQTPAALRHLRTCRRHGVEKVDPHSSFYRCTACGYVWGVMIQGHPRPPLRRGWWRCPNGCNAPE